MRKRLMFACIVGVVLVGMLALTGCPKKKSDPDPLNVSGTWVITQVGDSVVVTASLTHVGNVITGTVSDSVNYSVSISGSTAAAAGLTKPRDITLMITYSDARVSTLRGFVNDKNTGMSGTYTDSNDQSDQWSATRQAE
jgi:hypothetical protein